ncbi:MAG: tRNA lysidine(34) synthetase TilS, partial [Bdellovibrionales bacterium]|nr:tRNA lysidine(34) synthetase TilS [Bdellovibrionales bacterium]
ERKVANTIRAHGLKGSRLLMAISGGLDSLSLLNALNRIKELWNLDLSAAYIHHGPSEDPKQKIYRDVCASSLLEWCESRGISLVVLKNEELTKSEDGFRKVRRKLLLDWAKKNNFDWIVTAHHADDLLETRLIRLVRGIGPQGLKSIEVKSGKWFRPLLDVSRVEIVEYSNDCGLEPVIDPSNLDTHFLRNFIRLDWLPRLEDARPGSVSRLAKSLDNLCEVLDSNRNIKIDEAFDDLGLRRGVMASFSVVDRRRALASYMLNKRVHNYTEGHISEILKRLDTDKNEITFRVAGHDWEVNASHIRLVDRE